MDSNDDITILARVKGWEIFSPDWAYLRQFPVLELGTLCALSVGLHQDFAVPEWVFYTALQHFDGTDPDEFFCSGLDDAHVNSYRAGLLNEFLQRMHIAPANLSPRGSLAAFGDADSVQTLVRVADFATWADGKGWKLPSEFQKPLTASVSIQPAATPGAPESNEPTAPVVQSKGKRGITKAEILDAEWPMPKDAPSLESILDKIPKWVDEACLKVGRAGKGQSGSHLWNPAVLAVCLASRTSHKQWICNQVALTNLIRNEFSVYFDEWTKKQEML